MRNTHRIMTRLSLSWNAVGLAAVCLILPAFSSALEVDPLWTANPDMVMEGAAMVVDLDGDGEDEVLTAAYEHLIAVDGSGEALWRFDSRGRYSTCPAILERPGKSPLIYAGDNKGLFTALDGAGAVVWQAEIPNVFCSGPALADLDGDGAIELVQGNQAGMLYVMDALTGAPKWQTQLEGECSCPAIADLDDDGRQEVVAITGKGSTYCLDASGAVAWQFDMGATAPFWAIASPVLFSDSAQQPRVAVASHDGHVFCLDGHGNELWRRTTRGSVASTLSVGDFDADGRADIFAVTELGVLYRFGEGGRVLWDIDTQGRSLAAGAIIDLDGDGALEYMLCTQRGSLLAFDQAGTVVLNHQFDNRTINVTPAFGDIVKSRPGLEFAITGGESGLMFCFGIPASTGAAAPWGTYRCDNRLTGAWFGLAASDAIRMTPENLDWDSVLAGNAVTFRVANPNPDGPFLKARAVCTRPDGSRQAAIGKVTGTSGLLQLPVAVTAPGIYRFDWMLADAQDAPLLQGAREFTLTPYQNDQALAARAVLALREVLGDEEVPEDDTGIRGALQREASGIEEEARVLARLQTAAPGAAPSFLEDLDARTARLNDRATHALALAGVAAAIGPDAGSPIVVFEGVTWENRDVNRQLPTAVANPLRIARRCVPGEHEPVSVKLFNASLEPVTVTARAEAKPNGPAVTLFEVKPVPTNLGGLAWDPMVPIGDAGLAVPPLETREVWVDIDLTSVSPGAYAVGAVFSSGEAEAKASIALDVLPFTVAPPGAMRLCCWARYEGDAVQDLLAHGNTVFTASLPPANVGEGASPRIELDYEALDAFVTQLKGHDAVLLMNGIPGLGVPMESEAYVPLLRDYFGQLMAHLAAHGVPERNVALYPHDEPGGHGWDTVNHYIAFGRQALKARPGIQLYVNGGGDLAMFEALNEVAGIWCPGFYMLSEDTPEMEFLRDSGKTLWSYDCGYSYARPIGANTKTINIVAQYRLEIVHAVHFGASGVGYWCYNAGDCMWDPVELEYPLVYANPDGTHTTCRRWEAVRESWEDARVLIALRGKLDDDSVDAAVKERIRHLLDVTVAGLAEQTLSEARLGVARYVLDASNNDATVEQLRAEMMDCVALLRE